MNYIIKSFNEDKLIMQMVVPRKDLFESISKVRDMLPDAVVKANILDSSNEI